MKAQRASSRFSYVAALLAVALLVMAGVRSTVMQAAEGTAASSLPLCAGMTGMTMPMTPGDHAPGKAHKVCDFCSAAAHAPVCGTVTPIIVPLAVRYIAWRPQRALGPRGPPAVIAKARGPPSAPLTA